MGEHGSNCLELHGARHAGLSGTVSGLGVGEEVRGSRGQSRDKEQGGLDGAEVRRGSQGTGSNWIGMGVQEVYQGREARAEPDTRTEQAQP